MKVLHAFRATLCVLLALVTAAPVAATNLTGTFKHPDGSPVNGKLIFLLSQPARLNDQTAQIVPMVKIFSVTNGQLEAGAFLYGNDVMTPAGTYYLVRLVDQNNNLLFEQKWSIQGATLDLSTLTPTTTGVVLPDPLIKNLTTDQIVQGPVSFNSPLSVFSLSIDGNIIPGTSETNSLGNPTRLWRDFYALRWDALFTVGAIGSVVTPPAVAPTVALESSTGGTIAAGTYYCVVTYGNRNGETTASPAGSVTVSGSTNLIRIAAADYHWLTGAYKMRVYCGTASAGPFYLQTPRSYTRTIAAAGGSISRTSNVVTVTTTATHGFAPQDTVTISGVDDSSFNGTFAVKDVLTSTQFTYDQTAANASSQNGTVTFSTAIDTNWHYADMTGGIILSSIVLSGSSPPSTNTATIDPLQVAINQTRTGTDTADNVQTKRGKVLLGGTTYTLTTPLVLGLNDVLEGTRNDIDVSQAGQTGASRITCAWTDAASGCVMVMGRNVSIRNLSVRATAATNAIAYIASSSDMNGQYLSGVFAMVPSTSTNVAAIRVHAVKEAHAWHWNHLTVNGGRYAVLFTHSFVRGLTWFEGRCNLGASTPAGSSCMVQGSGYPDIDRGQKWGSLGGTVDAKLYRVVVEVARGRAFDWKGGFLGLYQGTENADSSTDSGTDALVYLDSNASSSGNTFTGFVVEDTFLFGHANASATVKFGPGGADYALVSCRNAQVLASASQVSVDLGGTGSWRGDNCRYPDVSPSATVAKIINAPSATRREIQSWSNNGPPTFSAPLRLQSRYFSGASGVKCIDFDSSGGGNQDDFVLFGNDCATEKWRTKESTGDLYLSSNLRWKTGGGGSPSNYFAFSGTPTAARTITWPDASFTVMGINTNQTVSAAHTFTGTPAFNPTSGAPFSTNSTAVVANLNADLLDGLNSVSAGTASTIAARDASGRLTSQRFISSGTALANSDFSISAGWGSTASGAVNIGTDTAWVYTITSNGSGLAANPTFTITFKDGTGTNTPVCTAKQTGGSGAIRDVTVSARSATAYTFIWNDTPAGGGATYEFTGICSWR